METFLKQTQEVLEFIEQSISDIDLTKIQTMVGIPLSLYLRLFNYVYGQSLSAYMRARKLSIAATHLLAGEWNVSEAANQCGYSNFSSFSRSFKEQFKVVPSKIDKQHYRQYYVGKMSIEKEGFLFQKMMNVTLERIDYAEVEEIILVGISSEKYQVVGHHLWEIFLSSAIQEKLAILEDDDRYNACFAIGYMTGFERHQLGEYYFIGSLKAASPTPIKGLEIKSIQGGTMARARLSAASLDDIIDMAYLLMCDAALKNGYQIKGSPFYWLEYYRKEEQYEAMGCPIVLELYMPCVLLDDDRKQGL